MRRIDIAIIITLIVVVAGAVSFLAYRAIPGQLDHLAYQQATIANESLKLYLPISPQAQTKGLGGVETLPKDQGMLFYMPGTDDPSIWMKDMLISIDAIWLNHEHRVVHIEHNLSPDTFPQTFRNPPETTARYVLELGSGEAMRLGIGMDDELVFDGDIHEYLRN